MSSPSKNGMMRPESTYHPLGVVFDVQHLDHSLATAIDMNKPISATSSSARLVNLEQARLLLVKGPDAVKFLQGQVTCDLRDLTSPVTRLGAQCTPKGRILLSFRAMQIAPENIALRIPASMMEKAKSSLGKYIVFSKAKLHDENEYNLFGLYGSDAQQLAKQVFGELPATNDGWIERDQNILIQLEQNRFECWIRSEAAAAFEQQLTTSTITGDLNEWKLLNIRAGVADILPETIEQFTPQEINYQLINGVNFRKGCYTGQEIVARLHYRGKLKRHMYRFSTRGYQLPAPGTPLLNKSTQQTCGYLVNAAFSTEGEIELLASLLDEQLDQVSFEASTEVLNQLPLPYAIPTADETNE